LDLSFYFDGVCFEKGKKRKRKRKKKEMKKEMKKGILRHSEETLK